MQSSFFFADTTLGVGVKFWQFIFNQWRMTLELIPYDKLRLEERLIYLFIIRIIFQRIRIFFKSFFKMWSEFAGTELLNYSLSFFWQLLESFFFMKIIFKVDIESKVFMFDALETMFYCVRKTNNDIEFLIFRYFFQQKKNKIVVSFFKF